MGIPLDLTTGFATLNLWFGNFTLFKYFQPATLKTSWPPGVNMEGCMQQCESAYGMYLVSLFRHDVHIHSK